MCKSAQAAKSGRTVAIPLYLALLPMVAAMGRLLAGLQVPEGREVEPPMIQRIMVA